MLLRESWFGWSFELALSRALRFLWSTYESFFAELACVSVDEPEHAVLVLHRCGVLVLACGPVRRERERDRAQMGGAAAREVGAEREGGAQR